MVGEDAHVVWPSPLKIAKSTDGRTKTAESPVGRAYGGWRRSGVNPVDEAKWFDKDKKDAAR